MTDAIVPQLTGILDTNDHFRDATKMVLSATVPHSA